MITLKHKRDCCGCGTCAQICPKQCITMCADNEGFLYPHVDTNSCIDCGLCQRVCPVINPGEPQTPMAVYATKNRNEEIRIQSSSGGVFTPIAQRVIEEGGVVFGAMFDDRWRVVHNHTQSIEGLAPLRGSKYVQSIIGDSYKLAKGYLEDNRKVLFTGTPCQIMGLRRFLRKEYDNLLTMEVACHGVPSPRIWQDYLESQCHQAGATVEGTMPQIVGISFRDKSESWHRYSFRICFAQEGNIDKVVCRSTPFYQDTFMSGFLKDLYLRPSCHHCAAKQGKSGADIIIADYWGVERIHSEIDDDKGVGLVIINTPKGMEYYSSVSTSLDHIKSDYSQAVVYNPCIIKSVAEPELRALFWREYDKRGIMAIERILKKRPSPIAKLIKRIKRVF